MLLLAERCEMTKLQEQFPVKSCGRAWEAHYNADRQYSERLSIQTVTYGNSTSTLIATAPDLHKRMAELQRANEGKGGNGQLQLAPRPEFIREVRTGSHTEFIPRDNKGHGYHRTVEEHKTEYADCIPGKEWLKAHEHDVIPEPTIEITVDGGKSLHVNGNYKQGMIKDFLAPYVGKVTRKQGKLLSTFDGTLKPRPQAQTPKAKPVKTIRAIVEAERVVARSSYELHVCGNEMHVHVD
jgi:hypothetical protein